MLLDDVFENAPASLAIKPLTLHGMKTFRLSSVLWIVSSVALVFLTPSKSLATDSPVNVLSLGVVADGKQSATQLLQTVLDMGNIQLSFPPGDYLIGSLRLPQGTKLISSSETRFHPDVNALTNRTLLTLQGGNIVIDGGCFVFSRDGAAEIGANELSSVISAKGQSDLEVRHISAIRQDNAYTLAGPPGKVLNVISLEDCEDVRISQCTTAHVNSLVSGQNCRRVEITGNKGTDGTNIGVISNGSEWIKYIGNWSSHVQFPFQWWGGDSDDTHPWVDQDTARIVNRGVHQTDAGFKKDTQGVFDVIATDNYAEYGVAAIWGSKGRDVLISNNISRFMGDVGFDTEGGEKVIMSNNLSLNSKTADFSCYFYGDELLISGNIASVSPEGDPKYQGYFVRLHSPGNADHFGNGRVLVEGNLFTSKMKDTPRAFTIEACRDVLISNNKFVNGCVAMNNDSRTVSITGNDFRFDLPGNYSAIISASGVETLLVRDNQLFRTGPEVNPGATDSAVSGLFGASGRRILDDNIIDGWSHPFDLSSNIPDPKSQIMLVRNMVSGEIALGNRGDPDRIVVSDNISLTNSKPIVLSGLSSSSAQ